MKIETRCLARLAVTLCVALVTAAAIGAKVSERRRKRGADLEARILAWEAASGNP